jgi:L-lactate permease
VYTQNFDPVSDSLGLTSIFAVLPVLALFVLLGGIKMVSPQNLAIGAAAVGLAGQEGDLFRKVLGWSLALVLIMCILVYLQSTSSDGWW